MAETSGQSNKPYHDIYLKYLLSALDTKNSHLDVSTPAGDGEGTLAEFEKCVFISIITDMVHQIGILNGGTVLSNPTAVVRKPMVTRFAAPIQTDLYDEKTLRPFHEALHTICETKLENDLANLRDLLQQCVNEISAAGKFTILTEYVERRTNDAYEEYQLIDEYMRNSAKLNELTEKWKRLKNVDQRLKDHLQMYQTECDEKRDDLKRTHVKEQNMVGRWEESRLEQMADVFKCELSRLDDLTTALRQKSSEDLLTIERLKVYNECKYLRIEKSIEYWTERCATEKSALGEEIVATKGRIKTVWSEYELLRDSYREREAFIENYRVEQKLLQNQREHEMKQRKAAIFIQAWWRGTMVRKCLGPYRPKKKKGKKGGK